MSFTFHPDLYSSQPFSCESYIPRLLAIIYNAKAVLCHVLGYMQIYCQLSNVGSTNWHFEFELRSRCNNVLREQISMEQPIWGAEFLKSCWFKKLHVYFHTIHYCFIFLSSHSLYTPIYQKSIRYNYVITY